MAREQERWKMFIDMNVITHKGEYNKERVSYMCSWIGKKGRDDLEGQTWREKRYRSEAGPF